MKKIISFDLDGTLVDGAYGNMVWLDGLPELYARRHSIALDEARNLVKSEYDSMGEGNLLWYDITYWLKRFDLAISIPDLLDRYSEHIRVIPGVTEVLERLSKEYMLVIASNAARIFMEKELSHSGLARYFQHAISATSDFEMVKKEEEFYRRLCRLLKVDPSEMVHVGDHAVFDVQVPLRAGLDAFHYNPGSQSDGRAICNFRELLDRL
jgi:HAD superfamily hydrolase (TIGR01493 family)